MNRDIAATPSWLNVLINNFQMSHAPVHVDNPPTLRGSSLPFCPILYYKSIKEWEQAHTRLQSYGMSFYTKVGTAIHEAAQLHLPFAYPDKVYGFWKCNRLLQESKTDNAHSTTRCCHRVGMTTFDKLKVKCPHGKKDCKEQFQLSEINLEDGPFSGHIDLLLLHEGKFYILDFKTTSEFLFESPEKAIKMGYYPSLKYLEQIESYATVIFTQYKVKVSGYAIVYLSRTNTAEKNNNYHIFYYAMNKNTFLNRRAILREQKTGASLVERFVKTKNKSLIQKIIDVKPCKKAGDYKLKMEHAFFKETCPFYENGQCFKNPASIIKSIG